MIAVSKALAAGRHVPAPGWAWSTAESAFWRRLARGLATYAPDWFLRYSPTAIALVAAAVLPGARRGVSRNLVRIRGEVSPARHAYDVARTFTSYAGCIAEVMTNGTKNETHPEVTILGENDFYRAAARGRGIIMVTAHTAGWELTGPCILRDSGMQIMMVMEPEPDPVARKLQDEARTASGLAVAHVGDDPFASLPLLHHLRKGGIVAFQIDRTPPGMRSRSVTMFGEPGTVPEGPMRLAQVSGAPILPAFSGRLGHRRYFVDIRPAIEISRRAKGDELDRVAQHMADAMMRFLEERPTEWFDWGRDPSPLRDAGASRPRVR